MCVAAPLCLTSTFATSNPPYIQINTMFTVRISIRKTNPYLPAFVHSSRQNMNISARSAILIVDTIEFKITITEKLPFLIFLKILKHLFIRHTVNVIVKSSHFIIRVVRHDYFHINILRTDKWLDLLF